MDKDEYLNIIRTNDILAKIKAKIDACEIFRVHRTSTRAPVMFYILDNVCILHSQRTSENRGYLELHKPWVTDMTQELLNGVRSTEILDALDIILGGGNFVSLLTFGDWPMFYAENKNLYNITKIK